MKTSVEALSDVEIKVEVEIPAASVDREYGRQMNRVGQRARIKGFRPGKAPKAIIRKQFGGTIAAETARALIGESLDDVLKGLDRTPLGEPAIEPGLAREGEPLTYAIRVQVKPIIEVHSWEDIEVAAPPATVSEEKIAERIGQLQSRHKERVPVEDRGADTGDILVANIEGHLDGERDPRLDASEIEIKVGAGQMIPGFEDQLMGATAGAKLEVEAVFPDDYHAEDLAGRPARWDVEVIQHLVEEVPEVDDDFAQDLGFDDAAALREDVRSKLQAEVDDDRKHEVERRVIAVLLERNPIQVPSVLQRAAMEDRARSMMQLLRMQGADQNMAMEIINSNLEGLSRTADTMVRRQLLLEAFAKQQAIDVDDEALSAEIVKRIEEHGEQAGKLYARPDMRETLRMELTQRAALERILDSAHVVDEKPEASPPQDEDAE